jgi:hypothetical protein
MRIVVFYISLCLMLLCGSQTLMAASVSAPTHGYKPNGPTHTPAKRQHSKLSNNRQDNSILDEADIDLDEDYLGRRDIQDESNNKLATQKYSLQTWLYCSLCPELILAQYNKRFNSIPPFRVNASPIYITQRVLKI